MTTCSSCLREFDRGVSSRMFSSSVFCPECVRSVGQCCVCRANLGVLEGRTLYMGLKACKHHFTLKNFVRGKPSKTERKHQRKYREFLRGKAYPEIRVWHKASDGCETTKPLEGAEFFQV